VGGPKSGAAAVASQSDVPEGLDWQAFLAMYFPGRSRHDFEALIAYGAYTRARVVEKRALEEAERAEQSRSDAVRATALESWEDEGGAGAPSACR
jgi:hypothetical protein